MVVARIFTKQRCFLKSAECDVCSAAIFELNVIFDTHFPFNITAPTYDLKIAVGHTAISIKF